MSAENFAEQMQVLARTAVVDPHIDSLELRTRRPNRRGQPHFSITFDDGYVDNLTRALPILEQNELPVTVFISTAFIGKPFFWWDHLDELTSSAIDRSAIVQAACSMGLIAEQAAEALTSAAPERLNATLERCLEPLVLEERNDLLDELSRRSGWQRIDPSARPLTESELIELAAHPLVTIGSHGHRHMKLARCTPSDAARDIEAGEQALAAILGPSRRPFAYPHGSHDKATAMLARAASFSLAVTTESRPVSILDSKWRLPRIASTDVNGEEFARLRRLPV